MLLIIMKEICNKQFAIDRYGYTLAASNRIRSIISIQRIQT